MTRRNGGEAPYHVTVDVAILSRKRERDGAVQVDEVVAIRGRNA
jgi:hypothetical protein